MNDPDKLPPPVASDPVISTAQREGRAWERSAYYDGAEKWTFLFWGGHLPFRRLFDQLDPVHLVELACGHGRHAEYLMQNLRGPIRSLTCLDILETNVDITRRRLEAFAEVQVWQNDGVGFQPVADGAASAVFCYDAMVHFDERVIQRYLHDLLRILKPGGKAVFHHSNNAAGKGIPYGQNLHARAYLTAELFAEMAGRAGLRVLEQHIIPWGQVPALDCLSLVSRPDSP